MRGKRMGETHDTGTDNRNIKLQRTYPFDFFFTLSIVRMRALNLT